MIAGNLEFLVSSLPDLKFQNTREFRLQVESLLNKYAGEIGKEFDIIEIFEREARKYLSASSFRFLQKIKLDSIHHEEFQHSKNRTVAAFGRFMFTMKKNISQYRNNKKNSQQKSPQIFGQLDLGAGTPLDVEVKLLQIQWDQLEDLGADYHFDLETLILYKLKLQVLLRWWSFNSEKGMEIFTQITKER